VRIAAVILAAGAGTRIGGPKALLRIGPDTFLARLAARFERPGVDRVIAVVGHEADRVRRESGAPASTVFAVNPRHQEGMLTSIWQGLDEAESAGAHAVMLQPVDHPLVEDATVDRVLAALHAGAVVAVPSREGRRGHPGGFARGAWPALRAAPPDAGARAVLAAHPEWIVHVPGDPGCLAGIDTPADYERLVGPRR
jgi:CTP:molybdopterin cytidylyltransferase MocA